MWDWRIFVLVNCSELLDYDLVVGGWVRGNSVVAASVNGSLCIVDLESGALLQKIQKPADLTLNVHSLTVTGEQSVALGSDDTVYNVCWETQPAQWTQFSDPARASSNLNHRFAFSCIEGWSSDLKRLVIIADWASSDVVCGGIIEENFKLFFIVSEEGLVQLPLSKLKASEETQPLAIAIDYTNSESVPPQDPEDPTLPPQPVLRMISSDGVFCAFRIVKSNQSSMHPLMNPKAVAPLSFPKELLSIASSHSPLPTFSPLPADPVSASKVAVPVVPSRAADPAHQGGESGELKHVPFVSKLTEDLGLLQNVLVKRGFYSFRQL